MDAKMLKLKTMSAAMRKDSLPSTPLPLREDEFMGTIVKYKHTKREPFKFVFKRKIHLRDSAQAMSPIFQQLVFMQVADEFCNDHYYSKELPYYSHNSYLILYYYSISLFVIIQMILHQTSIFSSLCFTEATYFVALNQFATLHCNIYSFFCFTAANGLNCTSCCCMLYPLQLTRLIRLWTW